MHFKKSKNFWKKFWGIMVIIFVVAAALNIFAWGSYNYAWSRFREEEVEADKAGYEESYFVCSREENVIVNGEDYVHFHAHRSAFLDGDYDEELLMPSALTYLDKAPAQQDGLVLFAKEVSSLETEQGEDYTVIHIYSLCEYALTKREHLISIAFIVAVIAGFVEIVLVFIFAIHKFRRKGNCSEP